jgi:hypothetical protein
MFLPDAKFWVERHASILVLRPRSLVISLALPQGNTSVVVLLPSFRVDSCLPTKVARNSSSSAAEEH